MVPRPQAAHLQPRQRRTQALLAERLVGATMNLALQATAWEGLRVSGGLQRAAGCRDLT